MPAAFSREDELARGREFPASEILLDRETVDAYLAAVEDTHTPQLGADVVPPVALAALAIGTLAGDPALLAGAVHTGQEVESLRLVRMGERVTLRTRVAMSSRRAGRLFAVVEEEALDAAGRVVMRGRSHVVLP